MFKKDILKKNEANYAGLFYRNGTRILTTYGNLTYLAEQLKAQSELPGQRGVLGLAIIPEEEASQDLSLLVRQDDLNNAYYLKRPGVYVHTTRGTRFILSEDVAGYVVANYNHEHNLTYLQKDGDWLPAPESFAGQDELNDWIYGLDLHVTSGAAFEAAKAVWKDLPGAHHVTITWREGRVK